MLECHETEFPSNFACTIKLTSATHTWGPISPLDVVLADKV